MDIRPALVADGQTAVPGQPSKRPFHHPAMPPQPLAALDALPRNPARDAASSQEATTAWDVVGLIGMHLRRPLASPPTRRPDGRDGVDEGLEEHGVVAVGSTQAGGEWDPSSIDHNMPLRARFAFIRGIRPGVVAPLFAGTLAESSEARDQSISSACPSRSRSARCNRSQTSASCQSRNRRQQVTPLPHPISWGSISQGMPVFKTKMIPANAARSETLGRPPLGFGASTGSRTWITSHNSSLTNGLLITGQHTYPLTRF